jgi:predicted anti-sigma-YlaC factor YlaD
MTPGPSRALDCHEARISLGVYVVGAIDPAERALVDAHLATCRDCRDELAGLAGLPALLARVSTEEAIALAALDGPPEDAAETAEPPRELLATVLDLTAARRRRRRWREASLGAAAALVIAAGVFAGVQARSAPAQPSAAAAAPAYAGAPQGPWQTSTGTAAGLTATVSWRSMGWGTQLSTEVHGIPVGTKCQLWVTDRAGQRVLAGSWVTDDDEGKVWYPSATEVMGKDVSSFAVTVGSGKSIEVQA